MNSQRFRIVIIGAGTISRVAHVPAVLASPIAELAAIVDPNRSLAADLCQLYGIKPEIADDISNVKNTFDAAIVATPNDLHAPLAEALIERGIPVLIEKPLAADLESAERIAAAAEKHGTIAAVGYQSRFSGACQALKNVLDARQFGAPIRFACQHGSRGGWSPASGYNLDTKRAGGGVLVTTGTHFLDRLIWLWGTPSDVSLTDNGDHGPESHSIARFTFNRENTSFSGTAYFSKLVALTESFVVETEEGVLVIRGDKPDTVAFRPKATPTFTYDITPDGYAHDPRALYQRQLEDFIGACRAGTAPKVDAALGRESVALLSRLYATRQPLSADHYA
ncbi:Gfo/Idh/MocA family oxidoreductase [Salinisphaera sp. T31B1]|uniref:Gfo/Idh/MocA family protein n=1 Tax=Salinisphaera sp. T31B1 TaxID=727963 RepID=UPI00333F225B